MKEGGLEDWKAGNLLFTYSPFAICHPLSAIRHSLTR
jgi:hypothetical protein